MWRHKRPSPTPTSEGTAEPSELLDTQRMAEVHGIGTIYSNNYNRVKLWLEITDETTNLPMEKHSRSVARAANTEKVHLSATSTKTAVVSVV